MFDFVHFKTLFWKDLLTSLNSQKGSVVQTILRNCCVLFMLLHKAFSPYILSSKLLIAVSTVYVLCFHYTLWTAERATLQKWCLLFFLDKENSITSTNYFTYLQRSLTQLAIYKYGSIYSWQLRKGNCNKIWHLKKMACVEEDGSQQNIFNDTRVLSFFLLIYWQDPPFLPGKGR